MEAGGKDKLLVVKGTTKAFGQNRVLKGVDITVPVTNTGSVAGDETVQVYVKRLDDAGAPIKSLKGFKKVSLAPGAGTKVKITLAPSAF